jgi:MOSC domain-containing protein YiiM
MKLVSINVAIPTTINYQGKQITTGIFKQPSIEPLFVAENNIQGDGQADLKNHGGEHKAVYAFAEEHYSYWAKKLNKPMQRYGAFGENLTISGFNESSIHIGDQFRIGQDCILEVTQPRVPCFKLGIAIGNNAMPRLFIESYATGAYLRVLQEGMIHPENEVELIQEDHFQMSVQTLFRAYFDKDFHGSHTALNQALLIPALSTEWKNKISIKLSALDRKT